jgi:hypothetical protein
VCSSDLTGFNSPVFSLEIESFQLQWRFLTDKLIISGKLLEELPEGEEVVCDFKFTPIINAGRSYVKGITKRIPNLKVNVDVDEFTEDITGLYPQVFGRIPISPEKIKVSCKLILKSCPISTPIVFTTLSYVD